jgi:transposase-like protein
MTDSDWGGGYNGPASKGESVMSKRQEHSREFKLQAAKLVVEQGYSIGKAAERLGINHWTLRDWVRLFRADGTLPPVGTRERICCITATVGCSMRRNAIRICCGCTRFFAT